MRTIQKTHHRINLGAVGEREVSISYVRYPAVPGTRIDPAEPVTADILSVTLTLPSRERVELLTMLGKETFDEIVNLVCEGVEA